MLLFLVPLQSPVASKDWPRVSRLFERTLRSICQQTCEDFRVFVICNQWPDIAFRHPAVTVIEEDFPIPNGAHSAGMDDKWLKLKRGMIVARSLAPAHVMFVDADDCVHRDLAALSRKRPEATGWFFGTGYMHDEGSRWLYVRRSFDRICGTSAIVRCAQKDFPQSMDDPVTDYFILCNGHGVIQDYLREQGTPLDALPFAGAVYNTDTGENHSGIALRAWGGKRMFFKKLINSRPLTARMREQFGLYDLARPSLSQP